MSREVRKIHGNLSGALCLQATHADALKVTKRAERMMDEGHFSSEQVRAQAELITTRWQELMLRTEERMKLVVAAHHWFKTAEQVRDVTQGRDHREIIMRQYVVAQVCTVFESLDREYARSEDWCASEKVGDRDKEAFMRGLVQRHNEQKEGFLKVCHHEIQ